MTWNPYGAGGPDPSGPHGDGTSGSPATPSSWSAPGGSAHSDDPRARSTPTGAGAHYVPGSPAVAHLGTDRRGRPGLRALAVLLVLGSFVYAGWHVALWGQPLLDSTLVANCPDPDARMSCLTSEAIHRWAYTPLVALAVAWGFASGAATEARNGRARGYLHLACGIAALVVGGLVSSL